MLLELPSTLPAACVAFCATAFDGGALFSAAAFSLPVRPFGAVLAAAAAV